MPLASQEKLDRLDETTATALRDRLRACAYDAAILDRCERIAPGLFDPVRLPLVRWHLERTDGPGAVLARLFAYADALARPAVEQALGEGLTRALLEADVLGAEGDRLVSRYQLMPFHELYVLHDPIGADRECVMGPGPTTALLAQALPSRAPAAVLDVGCGAGTFALLAAARGATRAVGTDISGRAVAVARTNARLNGLDATFVQGDLLAPVAGQRFDLLLAQPPYVPDPPGVAATTYLHGGAEGDELAVRLCAEAPAVLAPGGRAVLLFDSAVRAGRPLSGRLRAALGAAEVDLLVLAAPGHSSDAQAVGYAYADHPDLGPGYAEAVRSYAAHAAALGVRETTRALVVVTPAPGAPGGRYTVTLPVGAGARYDAAALDERLAALALASRPDDALLTARPRTARGARFIEERTVPDPSAPARLEVRFAPGSLAVDREVSEAVLALVGLCDGQRTGAEVLARFAELCQAPPAEVHGTVASGLRDALARGLLTA